MLTLLVLFFSTIISNPFPIPPRIGKPFPPAPSIVSTNGLHKPCGNSSGCI